MTLYYFTNIIVFPALHNRALSTYHITYHIAYNNAYHNAYHAYHNTNNNIYYS